MKESRHPHPHSDPRQPRHETTPGTNPPVFAWKPPAGNADILIPGSQPPVYKKGAELIGGYSLLVAKDADFTECLIEAHGLPDPVFLPEQPLPAGSYWWKWTVDEAVSEVFTFTISEASVPLPVPAVATWLQQFPASHPRILILADEVGDWRKSLPETEPEKLNLLRQDADAMLAQSHHMDEPAFLPNRQVDYTAYRNLHYPIMWNSRRFAKGAETLALAWLATGDEKYGRAACDRILSLCQWDPEGSSYLGHNDEAHMSVITLGPVVCDWVWDLFTDEERERVVKQFRHRGELTFSHMHDQGCYGITRFDSHAGREIIFLAQLAIVFHESIPDAKRWLEWLRPVLCGIWPIWSGDDGAWAEGISYSTAYVTTMGRFASILKKGIGVDLYTRPFWKNYIRWKKAVYPSYAEWMGFGDHTERWEAGLTANADLAELVARETQSPEFLPLVNELRQEALLCEPTPAERAIGRINATLLLAPVLSNQPTPAAPESTQLSHVFTDGGWASIRTGIDRGHDEVAFIFRSSPYGSISHSHANNNDFILHVGGKAMAMPTGYYCGYDSPHHMHWVWHTKANNCLTLSDASQLMRSKESRGYIEAHFENDDLAYFQGNADLSYQLQAQRCRRHVVYLKASGAFLLVDEFVAQPDITTSVQWNIHSWNPFEVSNDDKTFTLTREDSKVTGHFLFHHQSFITLGEGWDPPLFTKGKNSDQWHNQYHLRFTPNTLMPKRNLGVVLLPDYPGKPAPAFSSRREGDAEIAEVGPDWIAVNQADTIDIDGQTTDAIAVIKSGNARYDISVQGIAVKTGS